jgi:uncharacterized protein (DUF433 family)
MRPELSTKAADIDADKPYSKAYSVSKQYRRSQPPHSGNQFKWAFEVCRGRYPGISLDSNVLGGIPHIAGTRLAVSQVLARIYVLGSITAVAEYYGHSVTEEQVKEALAFAQSFVELAGDPH